MKFSQPLRIEDPRFSSFTTSRTQQSRLWFVNNRGLEERILGYGAKYQQKYQVTLYAFVFSGDHVHTASHFPGSNRACFFRDLNARTAEAVRALVPEYRGGSLFGRRYSAELMLSAEDIEDRFFYCALQPVKVGLAAHIRDYPGYNSFHDAINARVKKYKVIDWTGYRIARRLGLKPKVKDYTTQYELTFSRLPGYEHLSQEEYKELMLEKLEQRRLKLVQEWEEKGHVFPTKEALRRVRPGSYPRHTKTSQRHDYRPLFLSKFREIRAWCKEYFFSVATAYKQASERYRAGELNVTFPPYTYPPPILSTSPP